MVGAGLPLSWLTRLRFQGGKTCLEEKDEVLQKTACTFNLNKIPLENNLALTYLDIHIQPSNKQKLPSRLEGGQCYFLFSRAGSKGSDGPSWVWSLWPSSHQRSSNPLPCPKRVRGGRRSGISHFLPMREFGNGWPSLCATISSEGDAKI